MRKAVVLMLAVLALTGLATLVYADTTIFQDSWVYPLATWQGEDQATYGTTPSNHALTDEVLLSPFAGETGNYVAKITYDQLKESWSGRLAQASPGTNLAGVTKLQFKLRADATMPVNVIMNKAVVNDSNDNQLTIVPNSSVTSVSFGSGSWTTYESLAGTFTGRNMSAVEAPFGFYMTSADNASISGNVIFYIDDVKFVGGSSGTVQVTLTSGVVGVQIEQMINFDLLGSITTNTSYSSTQILDPLQNHFIVTNKGTDPCFYSVSLINPGGWTAVATTADAGTALLSNTDEYILWALFSGIAEQPGSLTDFGGDDELLTNPGDAEAGVGRYAYGAAENGYNVAQDAQRNLWVALHTPFQSTVGTTQQIIVVITANKL